MLVMTSSVGRGCPSQLRLTPSRPDCFRLLLCVCVLTATLTLANAASILNTGSPVGFFTNVASRLLSSELNLNLTWIQVYPTNQYTPSVHRLLQVTANIYDATTTNFYPSVFRPLFSRDADGMGANVYLSGYTNVPSVSGDGDAQLALPIDASDLAATNVPVINMAENVYGVPWVIGAKKGFPNFNKFGMQNVVQITRKLQIARSTIPTTSVSDLIFTNQLFVFSISNSIGIECWNSYYANYPNPVEICVRDTLSMQITNDAVGFASGFYFEPLYTNIIVNPWPGSAWNTNLFYSPAPASSFIAPYNTTATSVLLTNSDFYFGSSPPGVPAGFWPVSFNLGWETNKHDFQFPQFGLLTTNRLQVFMLDGTNVIDYVQFAGPESSRNLNAEFQTTNMTIGYDNMWSTALNSSGVPWGIINQIYESVQPTASDPVWSQQNLATVEKEIDGFAIFMGLTAPYSQYANDPAVLAMQTNYVMQVPFTPTATAYDYTSWQANDPLVHYLASDLNFFGTEANGPTTGTNLWTSPMSPLPRPSFNVVNDRYQPWGAKMLQFSGLDVNSCNLAFKDPLVRGSDYWNFPTNESSFGDWLGQIHRGTPWQTIYLKASDILGEIQNGAKVGTNTWMNWTGDLDATDASAMAPVRDRRMASLLASMLNTNDLRSLFSVNNANLNAWLVLFDGLTALTNNLPDLQLRFGLITPQFGTLVISSNSPQALVIASAIQLARASQPGRFFYNVGDILAIPQLTEQSPFLHLYNGTLSDGAQLTNGISDNAYEMIPSQLLSLLRADSIGSIAPVNSQIVVQFTGYDDHSYAIEVSSNLVNWVSISTNCPVNGMFGLTNSSAPNANQQFYRSILLQ